MAPAAIDYDPYLDQIKLWFEQGLTGSQIVAHLHSEGFTAATLRTLQRRLQQTNLRRRVDINETAELRVQIAALYYENYSDAEIVNIFTDCGLPIALRTVQRIRRNAGCIKRMTAAQRAEADIRLKEIIKNELDSGRCSGYGRELMITYLRTHHREVAVQ